MGECLGWCVSMAAWREGFVSSGCSKDDNNTNYSRHSLSMQSVLPVATVPFSIHRKSDVTSLGYKSAASGGGGGCSALPHLGGNLSVTLPGGMSSWCESSSFRAAFLPKLAHVYFELKTR